MEELDTAGEADGDAGSAGTGDGDPVRLDAVAAGDGRMRLRVTSYPVADRGRQLARVLTPSQPLRSTYIYPSTYRIGEFRSNRADLLRLGALIRVAAASPHSAVHIPVPRGAAEQLNYMGERPLALLVVREDAGVRPSDWPRLRERTRRGPTPGRRTTVTAPAPRDSWAPRTGMLDRLLERHPARMVQHAGTMVLVGRPEVLFYLGDTFTDAGQEIARNSYIHRHGEAWVTDLHGVVERGHGAPRGELRDTEIVIHAVEPIFHKARWQEMAAQRAEKHAGVHRDR